MKLTIYFNAVTYEVLRVDSGDRIIYDEVPPVLNYQIKTIEINTNPANIIEILSILLPALSMA